MGHVFERRKTGENAYPTGGGESLRYLPQTDRGETALLYREGYGADLVGVLVEDDYADLGSCGRMVLVEG